MDSRLIRRLPQPESLVVYLGRIAPFAGLRIIRNRLPDLVISDLTLPEMDGFSLLEELKRDLLPDKIAVILVSAKDLIPDVETRLSRSTSSIWLQGFFVDSGFG
jgi:CheY-like chemotaxis protein